MKHISCKRSVHGSAKRYFCEFRQIANNNFFLNFLVLSSSLNYFCLKQTNCYDAVLYFICFKKNLHL